MQVSEAPLPEIESVSLKWGLGICIFRVSMSKDFFPDSEEITSVFMKNDNVAG